jgi:hypothetical protein
MQKYFIVDEPTGYKVYLDPISSDAGKYLSHKPYVMGLIIEVLSETNLTDKTVKIEHEMGRHIGTTDIVETTDRDIIYYAKPVKKEHYLRFAKNRIAEKSSRLSIQLARDEDGNYEVCDTWIGPHSPASPGMESEHASSDKYWSMHAMVHDSVPIQTKTITKEKPVTVA